jgi:hypothetical protein
MLRLRAPQLFSGSLFPLAALTCLGWLPTQGNAAFLKGTWNSHIKSTQPAAGALAAGCTLSGGSSASPGAASHDATALAHEFNTVSHQLWATPYYPGRGTHCSNLNYLAVSREWHLQGTQPTQMAFAILQPAEFSTPGDLRSLQTAVTELSSASSLFRSSLPIPPGGGGITLAVGADDFHSTLVNPLDPTRNITPDALRAFHASTIAPSGIPFMPYLEALNALALVKPSIVLGIPAGSTTDHRLFATTSTGSGDEIDHTLRIQAAGSSSLRIPRTVLGVTIEALIGDSYIANTANAEPAVEVAIGMGAAPTSWRTVSTPGFLNPSGNSGSQFHPIQIRLQPSEVRALRASEIQVRFRLRNRGTANTSSNVNKLAIISLPKISIQLHSGTSMHDLHELMMNEPSHFSSFGTVTRASGRLTSVVESRVLGDSERLISKELGDAIDGVMLKTDSSIDNYLGSEEVVREVCGTLRVRGKPCLVVGWASDLQGVDLMLKTEMKRFLSARLHADGYLLFNFPLDLANPAGGLFTQPTPSSSARTLRFHWPLDTRGIDGYTAKYSFQIPGTVPPGAVYTLSGTIASGCSLNGSGQTVWSLGLKVPGDPGAEFSSLMIKDSAGAVFSPRSFSPAPGDQVQVSVKLDRSVGSSRCDLELTLTPSDSTLPVLIPTLNFSTDSEAQQFYSCFSELFVHGFISDPSVCE